MPTPCPSLRPAHARAPGAAGRLAPSTGAARPGRAGLADGRGQGGQSLVEFALILTPLLFLLLGVIQFGFIFNTYITVTNAAREAAREGTIYVYDRTATAGANDTARNERMRTTLLASFNGLAKAAPNFANSSTWSTTTSSGVTTFTTGDLSVSYSRPTGVIANDPRTGYRITVRATYRQDILIPLIGGLLPRDTGGRLPLVSEVTMVVN